MIRYFWRTEFIPHVSANSTKDSVAHSGNSDSAVEEKFLGIQGSSEVWVKTYTAKIVFVFVLLGQERVSPLTSRQKVAVLGWGCLMGEWAGSWPWPSLSLPSQPCSLLLAQLIDHMQVVAFRCVSEHKLLGILAKS